MSTTGWSAAAEAAHRKKPVDSLVERLNAALNSPDGMEPGSLCEHAATHEMRHIPGVREDELFLVCNGGNVATYAIPRSGRDESDMIRYYVTKGWAGHEQGVFRDIIRRLLDMMR